MYNSTTALLSTSSPICNLPHSSLRPKPSSSAYRYGSSLASYTEPFPTRQPALPVQASSLSLQPGSKTLLAKKSAGPAAPSACAQSACTATCPACIPTFRGSDAPVSMVDEDPSQGSHALEDWWSQVRVHLEDLPRLASRTPKTCSSVDGKQTLRDLSPYTLPRGRKWQRSLGRYWSGLGGN